MRKPDSPASGRLPSPALRPGLRKLLTLFLLWHLAAVIIAPFAVEPSSYLSGQVWLWFRPYLEAAYLNHGYHFFAPEPGPSHVVRYELQMPDGSTLHGSFPDAEAQRPRLLYHRYFMLSERLSPVDPQDTNATWKRTLAESYARHLYLKYGAQEVQLFLRRRAIPYPSQVQRGVSLDDPSLLQEIPLASYPPPEEADNRLNSQP